MIIEPLHPTFPLSVYTLESTDSPPGLDYSQLSAAQDLVHSVNHNPPAGTSLEELARLSPGELAAAGLIGRLMSFIILRHVERDHKDLLVELNEELQEFSGQAPLDQYLSDLLKYFPAAHPTQGDEIQEPGVQARVLAACMLDLARENPALRPYDVLLNAPDFTGTEQFLEIRTGIEVYFDGQPIFRNGLNFWQFLKQPFMVNPDSIYAQLEYILTHWKDDLDENWLDSLRRGLDAITEEQRFRPAGPGPPRIPDYSTIQSLDQGESRRFSPDQDWMPSLVLLAKNAYVWLDQLSKAYQRPVERLDQIPEQELEKLASRGITGLWLIGIWKRSPASKKIKQLTGNPEAEASAYALDAYVLSERIGGEEAYRNLRDRAAAHGIRLAADMVPNHVGIDSRWVKDHPDWFISLPEPPFPGYTFQGPDLAESSDLQIYLEDHYYDQSDAAVVFKRVDTGTGKVRYIYHGNDGTAMPWNDTAQLNYLNDRVREAVLNTILNVAEKFSVIRFDAAMVLTKKHFQRLWYPEPGSGGAIPSRAQYGLRTTEFNRLFPREFWRQVVDRVAEQAPDTLLLAEAFWMMEGYFVRSLGMHRVYNSAFMNMLKNEDNAKYRTLIKETLNFDPQILKRYVNFLNNPDEETAVAQFGKGGKYFGACLMMVTMPGLPMFGHGQIEGYSEKYGMEYRRSYHDEKPDRELIARHEREIFPLLKERSLFAGVEHFVLYDFQSDSGGVNEDVFAYSNRKDGRAALVVFHNLWGDTRGWIFRASSPHPGGLTLADGLAIKVSDGEVVLFRDQISGLQHLVTAQTLQDRGLHLQLGAYAYHVFRDFRILEDPEGYYAQLADQLRGAGIQDLEGRINGIRLQGALRHLENLLHNAVTSGSGETWVSSLLQLRPSLSAASAEYAEQRFRLLKDFYHAVEPAYQGLRGIDRGWTEAAAAEANRRLGVLENLALESEPVPGVIGAGGFLAAYLVQVLSPLQKAAEGRPADDLLRAAQQPQVPETELDKSRLVQLVQLLRETTGSSPKLYPDLLTAISGWFERSESRDFLEVHKQAGIVWFRKEALLRLTASWLLSSMVSASESTTGNIPDLKRALSLFQSIKQAAESSGYQVQPFLEQVRKLDHDLESFEGG